MVSLIARLEAGDRSYPGFAPQVNAIQGICALIGSLATVMCYPRSPGLEPCRHLHSNFNQTSGILLQDLSDIPFSLANSNSVVHYCS